MNTVASQMSRQASLPQAKPWLSWAGFTAAMSIAVGIYWDISWHESIGRDTFWTPAHLLVQFGAILAGLAAAWVIFRATFAYGAPARSVSVGVVGFRGPLGAFVFAWGAVAMLTSAPFDDWWHNAYGLDVKIISPPHILLALGIAGINWGGALLTVAEFNNAQGVRRRRLQYLLLAIGGLILLQIMTVKLEYTNRVLLHSGISYMVISIGLLLTLEAMARASGHRWARTLVSGTYTMFVLLALWILPLFPAQPKLGPVNQNITHMVPLPFPILIVVPAFVLDVIWPWFREPREWGQLSRSSIAGVAVILAWPLVLLNLLFSGDKREAWNRWLQAAAVGIIFMGILIVVEWPFATFLMSGAARNPLLAPNDFPFFAPPNSPTVRHVFIHWEATAVEFWRNITLAFVSSIVSMRIGIAFGNWLSRVRR